MPAFAGLPNWLPVAIDKLPLRGNIGQTAIGADLLDFFELSSMSRLMRASNEMKEIMFRLFLSLFESVRAEKIISQGVGLIIG